MPLEMRKTSQWWYGRYNVGGKVICVNLEIPIKGRRPRSMRELSLIHISEPTRPY